MATKAPAKKKLTLDQRVSKDPALRARVLANAGLRSKLSTSVLKRYAPDMAAKRELNVRLKQPITPGSAITERDLARDSRAAMDVKYGPLEAQQKVALGQEQARQRDVGGWYDQYLNAVRQHSANVGTIGQQAATTGQNLQAGVTGLGQAGYTQLQGNANAAAAQQGVAPAGNLAPMENQALAVRQALTGSFVAQQAAQNAAAQAYSDTLANVVAPGQKLGAMMQQQGKVKLAQDDITATARQRGADTTTYRSERRADEAKNVLAKQALQLDTAKTQTQLDQSQQTIDEQIRSNKADEKQASINEQNNVASEQQKATEKGNEIYTSGAFNGKRKADVAAMSQSQRDQLVQAYNERTGGADKETGKAYREQFFGKYGVYPATTHEVNQAKADIGSAGVWLGRLTKGGKMDLGAAGRILTTGQKGQKVKVTKDNKKDYPNRKVGDEFTTEPIPKLNPVLIRAAMDKISNKGQISASTADRLHRSGFSVPGLGLVTGSVSAPAKPKPKPPLNVGGNLGGFPK